MNNVDYIGRPFEGLRELALSAGAGGGILGGHLLGWRTVCAVERDRFAASILAQRQNDGALYPFPIWDDVCTFDGIPWRGIVDVVSGGFPCQDISIAGKGAGLSGGRSGLWREFARIIREVQPRFAFVENSPMLTNRGLDAVLSDLAAMGYNAEWGVFGADDVGAPHQRKRIWIIGQLANADRMRQSQPQGSKPDKRGWVGNGCEKSDMASAGCDGGERLRLDVGSVGAERQGGPNSAPNGNPWSSGDPADGESGAQPFVGRVADGVAHRVDRLRAIGNGQVPLVAAIAFSELHKRLNK